MKKIHLSLSLILVATALLAQTAPKVSKEPTEEDLIKATLTENLKALQIEDVEMELSTIHSQSPFYASTRDLALKLFDTYDIQYKLIYFKVLELKKDEASVRTKQVSKKIKGPAFQNTKMTMVHKMKKENGKWKILNSQIEKAEKLP